MDQKLDAVRASMTTTTVTGVWLYVGLAAGVFGTMARAFGWI